MYFNKICKTNLLKSHAADDNDPRGDLLFPHIFRK